MSEEVLRLQGPIALDPYFAFERPDAVPARVTGVSVAAREVHLELLDGSFTERRIRISGDALGDVGQIRRGDCVAYTSIDDVITGLAITSRALEELPSTADWTNEARTEERLRFRELDILLRPEARRMIAVRSAVVFGVRQYLQERGFVEVELPVLKRRPDIAPAQHFEVTGAGGETLYLRTTFPPFERVLVSLDRAYAIGPNFRKGDWSHKNIPEFSMLCLAMRGATYLDAHRLVRTMMAEVVRSVTGRSTVTSRGNACDLASWEEVSLNEVLSARFGVSLDELDEDDAMAAFAERYGIPVPTPREGGHMFRAALFDRLFETLVVPGFPGATFFTETPWYLAGPAERHPLRAGVKMRGEGYVAGMELTNAKNILTDHQALWKWHRSIAEEKRRAGFREEYTVIDKDYLRSAAFGFQPGALASVGMDRLIMLALGVDAITEAVAYPLP